MSKKHTRKPAPTYPPSWYDPIIHAVFPWLRPGPLRPNRKDPT